MDKESLAHTRYRLYRELHDQTQELVSEHPDFASGWSAGQRMTHEEKENAYSLYDGGRRVAKFGHARLMPRFAAERVSSMVGAL